MTLWLSSTNSVYAGHITRTISLMILRPSSRFRHVPTFGLMLHTFSKDIASMGRLAARDFEDILQVNYKLLLVNVL